MHMKIRNIWGARAPVADGHRRVIASGLSMSSTDDNNGSDDRTSSDPTASPGATSFPQNLKERGNRAVHFISVR